MKVLLIVGLTLLGSVLTPAVASTSVSKANKMVEPLSNSDSALASLVNRCEKNIVLFKGKLVPDVYSLRLIEDYYSKRESMQKVIYEMNDAEFIKAVVHFKQFRNMGISETLSYCDKAMNDIYKRFMNAFNDNVSAEESLVTNIHQGSPEQFELEMPKVGYGLLDTDIDLTSNDASLENYQNIIIKSNPEDEEWVLTNSLHKLATYEIRHDKVARIRFNYYILIIFQACVI